MNKKIVTGIVVGAILASLAVSAGACNLSSSECVGSQGVFTNKCECNAHHYLPTDQEWAWVLAHQDKDKSDTEDNNKTIETPTQKANNENIYVESVYYHKGQWEALLITHESRRVNLKITFKNSEGEYSVRYITADPGRYNCGYIYAYSGLDCEKFEPEVTLEYIDDSKGYEDMEDVTVTSTKYAEQLGIIDMGLENDGTWKHSFVAKNGNGSIVKVKYTVDDKTYAIRYLEVNNKTVYDIDTGLTGDEEPVVQYFIVDEMGEDVTYNAVTDADIEVIDDTNNGSVTFKNNGQYTAVVKTNFSGGGYDSVRYVTIKAGETATVESGFDADNQTYSYAVVESAGKDSVSEPASIQYVDFHELGNASNSELDIENTGDKSCVVKVTFTNSSNGNSSVKYVTVNGNEMCSIEAGFYATDYDFEMVDEVGDGYVNTELMSCTGAITGVQCDGDKITGITIDYSEVRGSFSPNGTMNITANGTYVGTVDCHIGTLYEHYWEGYSPLTSEVTYTFDGIDCGDFTVSIGKVTIGSVTMKYDECFKSNNDTTFFIKDGNLIAIEQTVDKTALEGCNYYVGYVNGEDVIHFKASDLINGTHLFMLDNPVALESGVTYDFHYQTFSFGEDEIVIDGSNASFIYE